MNLSNNIQDRINQLQIELNTVRALNSAPLTPIVIQLVIEILKLLNDLLVKKSNGKLIPKWKKFQFARFGFAVAGMVIKRLFNSIKTLSSKKARTSKEVLLYRTSYQGPQITGHLIVFQNYSDKSSCLIFECKTLELNFKNNDRDVSSLPTGFYQMVFEYSPAFKMNLWELKGVPNRSEIKVHFGNYHKEFQGCIGVGSELVNLNGDNLLDLTNSRNTLERFHAAMGDSKSTTIRVVGRA